MEPGTELSFGGFKFDALSGVQLVFRRSHVAQKFDLLNHGLVFLHVQDHGCTPPVLCEDQRPFGLSDLLNE
jgi:hypothetical protein